MGCHLEDCNAVERAHATTAVTVIVLTIFVTSLIAGIFSTCVVIKLRFWGGLMQQLVALDTFALLGVVISEASGAIIIFMKQGDIDNAPENISRICNGINIVQFNFELLVLSTNTSMLLLYVYLRRWVVYGNKLIRYDVVRMFFFVFWLTAAGVGTYLRNQVNQWQVTQFFFLGIASDPLIVTNQIIQWFPVVVGCICMFVGWLLKCEDYTLKSLKYYNDLYFWFSVSFLFIHIPTIIIEVLSLSFGIIDVNIFGVSNNWKCLQNVFDGFIFYFFAFKKMDTFYDSKSFRFVSNASELTHFTTNEFKFLTMDTTDTNGSNAFGEISTNNMTVFS